MTLEFQLLPFNFHQYTPAKNERVLGIVTKTGKQHRVDIQASVYAVLPELAFQGATKRNKPTLQARKLLFMSLRMICYHKPMDEQCILSVTVGLSVLGACRWTYLLPLMQ